MARADLTKAERRVNNPSSTTVGEPWKNETTKNVDPRNEPIQNCTTRYLRVGAERDRAEGALGKARQLAEEKAVEAAAARGAAAATQEDLSALREEITSRNAALRNLGSRLNLEAARAKSLPALPPEEYRFRSVWYGCTHFQ